ncbi:hypothetical protein G6O67_000476 [Ophiocordyceps sinensis]|uniref:Aminoglycoside phosphotransferase domain-containing protein n=1 Tax=Ophiocordyceps sinensis TaxID=72228 RepID=A0A8H4PZB9_9HYPO|nr:hypothetical protein G6O67_000476 [Ophiocordyceps sinensis]
MSATLCVSAPATSSASCASLCAFAALHGIQCAEQTRDGSGHDEVDCSKDDDSPPEILAFGMDDGSEPLSTFLILEFIQGDRISFAHMQNMTSEQRANPYTSLADIYMQLRRLEFPSIGNLVPHPHGFRVGKMNMSMDINMQEVEGLEPSVIQAFFYNKKGLLMSVNDHVSMLQKIAYNAFFRSRIGVEEDMGTDAFYHLDIFRKYAQEWVDACLDRGPLVVVHGDLQPHNLIVDENMAILAMLDWYWSRVVPLQLFTPPLW